MKENIKRSLYDYCIEENRDDLLAQWHPTKNKGMDLSSVTPFSNKKAWWICEKGHEYEMVINDRTSRRSSCPYCRGSKVLGGFNDLETVDPRLAKEWHPTRNETLTARMVTPGSRKKVWWRCEKGHEWQAVIKSRHSGVKCPVCTRKVVLPGENDLGTLYPAVAAQWHPTKNEPLTAKDVFPGSLRKVWWVCEKGHEWKAGISSRREGRGCPICAGKVIIPGENDLGSRFPAIAAQWHPTKNRDLLPGDVAGYANRKVWWVCEKGHEYEMSIKDRTLRQSSCPYCCGKKVLPGFNDLATVNPQIAKEWYVALNGEVTPENVTAGSSRKVWWQCQDGHVWKAKIWMRAKRNCGCPVCAGRYKEERLARPKENMGE